MTFSGETTIRAFRNAMTGASEVAIPFSGTDCPEAKTENRTEKMSAIRIEVC